MTNIEWVKREAEKLIALLADPHPGLMTWAGFYGERMRNISNFWCEPEIKEACDLIQGALMSGKLTPSHATQDLTKALGILRRLHAGAEKNEVQS
ncbi:MAG: hypothetical protein WC700_18335 [Gemmatimonadaceae bacterium]|jgi:hypothetical protein